MTNAMFGIEPTRWRDMRAVGHPEAPRGHSVTAQGAAQRSPGFPRPTIASPERAAQRVLNRCRGASVSFVDIRGVADHGFNLRDDWAAPSGLVIGLDAYPGRAPLWGWACRSAHQW